MSCQAVIPETRQAHAVPDAATVYFFLSGRLADAPLEKGAKNYPYVRSSQVSRLLSMQPDVPNQSTLHLADVMSEHQFCGSIDC